MKHLVVVDMQKDFIDGALGTREAQAIVPAVKNRIAEFDGRVWFTRDTHTAGYLKTQEGAKLPVEHCICGAAGWQLETSIAALAKGCGGMIFDKPAFGSVELACRLAAENAKDPIEKITLVGLCTDICVISNALLLKAFLPETPIAVDASCCAGVTPQSHLTALSAMKMCQITIENE